jgi:hypothetical protein
MNRQQNSWNQGFAIVKVVVVFAPAYVLMASQARAGCGDYIETGTSVHRTEPRHVKPQMPALSHSKKSQCTGPLCSQNPFHLPSKPVSTFYPTDRWLDRVSWSFAPDTDCVGTVGEPICELLDPLPFLPERPPRP